MPFLSGAAETWLGIVFVVVVELVSPAVKTGVLGAFLFLMNNAGGNLPVLVDPLSKAVGYREALVVFYPTFVLTSRQSRFYTFTVCAFKRLLKWPLQNLLFALQKSQLINDVYP